MGRFFTLGYKAGATVAAPAITYGSSDVTWYDGIAITPLTVTNTGGAVTSYSVDPALPTGVSLNTSTGEISGTPTALDADDTYTITATGPGGEDTFDLTAEVLASLLTGMIAYWNLDEASGTRADSHTNGLDLTDNNTVTSGLGVDGVSTAAAFTKANSEYLSHTADHAFDMGDADYTIAGWGYRTASAGAFMGTWNTPHHYGAVFSGGNFQFFAHNGTALTSVPKATSADTWFFFVAGYDATAGAIFLRINNGTPGTSALDPGPNGEVGFYLGRAVSWDYHDGRAGNLGVWRRLLSDDEQTWLYNSGSAARTYAAVAAYTG